MEIGLKKYFVLLRKHLWIMAACAFVFTILAAVFTSNTYYPIYQASSEFMVNVDEQQKQVDYGSISVIIKTPVILDKVIQWYPDLGMTAGQLGSSIEVSNMNQSQIIKIAAQSDSYDKAVKIANDVTAVIKSEMPKIVKIAGVTILNPAQANDNPQPVNPNSHSYFKRIILSFAASLVVAIGIIFFIDSMDDTLKTEADIREIFNKSSLAVVPRMKDKQLKPSSRRASDIHMGEASHATSSRSR